jgi:hypothetical protein
MPRYEVLRTSYIDQPDSRDPRGFAPKLLKPGAKIEWDGWPGTSLKPLDAEAERRCAIMAEHRKRQAELGPKAPPLPPLPTTTGHDKADDEPAAPEADTKPPAISKAARAAINQKRREALVKARATRAANRAKAAEQPAAE